MTVIQDRDSLGDRNNLISSAPQRLIPALAEDFLRDGYVLLPQLITPAEIEALRADSGEIISGGWADKANPTDYMHDLLPDTGEDIFHRVQYIFPKARHNSFLILLGQPFILELVQYLLRRGFRLCRGSAGLQDGRQWA